MSSEAWTVRKLLEWTEDFFRKKELESPRLEAQILLAHVLECKKIDLYVRHAEIPDEPKRAAYRELIKKRAEGTPVAYLVGYREFFSINFAVNPSVLIPRPETETLVIEALKTIKPIESPDVLDLGTGSGCIAISIAKHHPTANIIAIDLSPEAIAIATQNATTAGVANRIQFLQGDLIQPVESQKFDLIVSNPPYISPAEIETLQPSVKNFEPRMALDGGLDGLDFYRRIAMSADKLLKPNGRLFVEIGHQQDASVRDILGENAQLSVGPTFKDTQSLVRVVSAQRKSQS